jgi:hypothetical protein
MPEAVKPAVALQLLPPIFQLKVCAAQLTGNGAAQLGLVAAPQLPLLQA